MKQKREAKSEKLIIGIRQLFSIPHFSYSKLKLLFSFFFLFSIFYFLFSIKANAQIPASTNYRIVNYGFGGGGTASSSSTGYSLFGTIGQVEQGSPSSTNYFLGGGLEYALTASAPAAPTFTNPGQNYDRLLLVINRGQDPLDTQYAITITPDNWQTTEYVQADGTIGINYGPNIFQTYSQWNGSSGTWITGLSPNTTYTVRVKARHGSSSFYTESWWGPQTSAATSVPSLTFGVDQPTVTFDNLNPGNSFTDSAKSTIVTTSTNAYNGYIVTGYSTQVLTSPNGTITDYTSPNSAPTTWSGTGFGYTTNDSSLTGGTANRFTSGGPKYAGFTQTSPGDPVADHAGPVLSAIANEQFTISYRLTAATNQAAGKYTTTVIYIVTPTY